MRSGAILWTLLVLACLVLATAFGPPGGYGVLFLVALAIVIVRYLLVARHALAAFVFTTIGASMRQNLPLPEALESAAAGQRESSARVLRRIAKLLREGRSLGEAIRLGYPACPGHAAAMIAAAERIDQLPRALASIEADLAQKGIENRKLKPVPPAYPLCVIFFVCVFLTGWCVFILPKFQDIFRRELGSDLPATTRIVSQDLPLVAWWGMVLVIAAFVSGVPAVLYAKFRPRRPHRPRPLSRLGDLIKWHVPGLRWFELNASLVQVVEVLRLSLEAGCTVDEAIANTVGLDVNACYRRRLLRWAQSVERGENVSAAARRHRVGSALAWAFDQQVNPGNAPQILESLERFYRSNYNYLANMVRYIFWPCVVIALAAMVGFIVHAIFAPLVAIIQAAEAAIP